jgi:succinate dehydrogenase/fumarate reductase flavoprotein subunit
VQGVEYTVNGQTHRESGPVVLATGGYAADFDDVNSLLKKHRPDLMHLPTTNGDHCTGDGQKMVASIGGKLIDLEKVQVHPTGLVDPKEPDAKVKFLAAEALRGVGGLLLDNEGNRFADELGHRDYVTQRMWDNDKFPVRLILNGASSKAIDWHCRHYTGRGLMKKFESGDALAKEMGLSADKLKSTFEDYNAVASGKQKDPFGKKFFESEKWKMDDTFHVALMTPVLHYTMGGLEIDPESRVLDTSGKPIEGLFASGEIAGGVHGANRLGGSSLLGCVVFGRVAGASVSSYLLRGISTGKIAAGRAGQVAQHLETTVRVHPETQKLDLTFSWGGQQEQSASPQVQSSSPASSAPESSNTAAKPAKKEAPKELKEYTMDEVAKHNKDDDCWVVIDGQVLDTTAFLDDHPGGRKAILLYKGRDGE